jgi:hypothetical protein
VEGLIPVGLLIGVVTGVFEAERVRFSVPRTRTLYDRLRKSFRGTE